MSDTDWIHQINGLIYRIQRKDRLALKELYSAIGGKLLAIIVRIVNDRVEAEDTLQEVFIKIWEQSDKYSGRGSAWGWLCVLARHSALDRLRSLNSHSHASIHDDEEWLEGLFEADNASTLHSINRCLGHLKEQTRKSILMSFVYGHSHGEVSSELSVPLGTVKAWIRRGLQELKQCLAV